MTPTATTGTGTDVLTARSAMSHPVIVSASAPLIAVWDVMQRLHTDLVVVCDQHGPLGVVDKQDVWRAWTSDLGGQPHGTGRSVVTATPCVSVDTPLADVCTTLLGARHETVLVVDDDGTYRGVVTSADVVAVMTRAGATSC